MARGAAAVAVLAAAAAALGAGAAAAGGVVPAAAAEAWFKGDGSGSVRDAFASPRLVYGDTRGPGGTCQPGAVPPIPGNSSPSLEEWCEWATATPLPYWDEMFAAAYPLSPAVPRGEMFGCVVSNSFTAAEARGMPGWAGKKFGGAGRFTNIVLRGPFLPPDFNAYPGRYYVAPDSGNFGQSGERSWRLDYSANTGIGILDALIDRFPIGQYLRNFGDYRDEMREVAPGMWLGKLYALPLTMRNPSPFTIDARVPFVLFQGCNPAENQA